MSGTVVMRVGDKGRLVVPAEVREHRGWVEGTTLIGVESDNGLLLMSREDARAVIRDQLAGRDLVRELLEDRATQARREAGRDA